MSRLETARQTANEAADLLGYYENDGCKLVRLSRKTKKSVDPGWPHKNVPLSEIIDWYERGGNIGKQLGAVSDWRGAVDCDCPEAVRLAPRFLPTTLRLGKGSGAPDVYLYRSPGLGFNKFADLDGSTLIDLKASADGAGHQIAVPPSIHPDKGPYRWEHGYNPAAIAGVPASDLRAAVGALAVATLITRHLPGRGRHDLAMALAGYLLRNGEAMEDVEHLLTAAWEAREAPRDHVEDVRRIVADTAAKLKRGEPATGGRTLEELVPGTPAKIAKFLGWERADNRDGRRNYTRSDLGNAERFVDMHGDKVRWCPARKSFFLYDGARLAPDERGHVVKLAHETARSIFRDAADETDEAKQREIAKFAVASQNRTRVDGMLSQAKPYLAVGMGELDRDPWDLNCKNGTLDLRTGELRAHDPADLITKLAGAEYDPAATCPRFERFLNEALVDENVISFVKRFAGYTLSGDTRERLFAILHGGGMNGKTSLVNVLQSAMGDYAQNTDVETILAKKYQGVGNDVAALKGARFVSAAEVEQGRRLAESKVKQLTGSDTVTARFLFGEPFDFRPQFKLWLSTNNKPVIQGTDDAIWDRIRLIPFEQRFEGSKADLKLSEKLREELAGILAWMVEGCLEWQEHGLGEPESVKSATDQYRQDMDTLAAFLEDRCVIGEGLMAPASRLYKTYQLWCDDAGEHTETQKMFGMRLSARGFISEKIKRGQHKDRKGWLGIGLRADDPEPEDPGSGDNAKLCDASGAGDGPPGGGLADDRPLSENGGFAGKTPDRKPTAEDSGPTNQQVPFDIPRVYKELGKRSASSASSAIDENTADEKATVAGARTNSTNSETHTPEEPTEEQAQKIAKLVHGGTADGAARAAVLGAYDEWLGS